MSDSFTLLYDAFMVPLELLHLGELRWWLLPQAAGRVLEVGAGTGASLGYYDTRDISSLVLTDAEVRPSLGRRAALFSFDTTVHECSAEVLPFGDSVFDTTVSNLVFCTVPQPDVGLRELYRVLKPGGRHLFMEHVRPRDRLRRRLFDRVTPAWRRISGGCHLNRDTVGRIKEAGFEVGPTREAAGGIFVAGVATKPY